MSEEEMRAEAEYRKHFGWLDREFFGVTFKSDPHRCMTFKSDGTPHFKRGAPVKCVDCGNTFPSRGSALRQAYELMEDENWELFDNYTTATFGWKRVGENR